MLTEINGERYNIEAILARLDMVCKEAAARELQTIAALAGDLIRDLVEERASDQLDDGA